MIPTLKQLISGLTGLKVTGKDSVAVRGLATDSRRVVPGSMFIALPGLRTNGHYFVSEAIDRGASVIVCEKDCWVPPNVTLVRTDDLRSFVARAASRYFGHPEQALEFTGFLGTSGKTVASTLLKHFLNREGPLGVLGTINYSVGNRTLPAHRTTPEAIELYGLCSQIKERGCERVLMEVSSHGIDQKRVEGLQFRNLVLINLTPEHLHYHGSLEDYVSLEFDYLVGQAKELNHFIAGIDDERVCGIVESAPEVLKEKAITFGCSTGARIRATDVRYSERDTRFTLIWPEGEIKLVSPLLGEFNLQNTLAAIACGYAEGLDPVQMGADLLSFPSVRGRMERLDTDFPFNILIDYMHTEAAYEKGLEMLRGITKGRLITIFGCGGNRDPKTRPVITRIVSEKSDLAFATSDNPRNETIEAIFEDMRRGNETMENLSFIDDRRAAIATAISRARPGDTIVVAGKGHETFQEFGDCVVPFDDRAVAQDILQNQQWHNR